MNIQTLTRPVPSAATYAAVPPLLKSHSEAIERATALGEGIRARTAKTEADRCVPRETIDELIDNGLFGVVAPKMFGGSELGFAALVDVATTLSSSCGSTGWVYGVLSSHNWLLALFPLEAQQEVAVDPRALTATVFRMGGKTTRVDGGYRMVGGEGRFCSGIDHSQWVILGNAVHNEDGPPEPRYFLVPVKDVEIVDDWFTVGMRGTGSRTILVRDAFIPEHRSVPFIDILRGTSPGADIHQSNMYRAPFNNAPPLALIGAPLGMARNALQMFVDSMAKKLTGCTDLQLAEQSATFARIGQISADIDSAYALVMEGAIRLDQTADPSSMSAVQKEKVPRNLAYAAQKCRYAVTSLFELSGGSGIYDTSDIQRIWRDVNSASGHFAFTWDSAAVNFGRTALGLPVSKFVLKSK